MTEKMRKKIIKSCNSHNPIAIADRANLIKDFLETFCGDEAVWQILADFDAEEKQ
jgi:hypothetical protein